MDEFDSNHAFQYDKEYSLFGKSGSIGENGNEGKKKRLRRELESLHQEMEVTGYAKGKMGHRQRKIPRDISKIRTQKRKLLEKLDEKELAVLGDDEEDDNDGDESDCRRSGMKRLRGSRVAAEDSVIQGSLIFSSFSSTHFKKDTVDAVNMDRIDEKPEHERKRKPIAGRKFGIDRVEEEEEAEVTATELSEFATTRINDEVGRSSKEPLHVHKQQQTTSKPLRSSGPSAKKRRKMYRLRNFQSLKMAQKHGSAIAAHAMGQPRLAIEKLKAVAKAAPSAPQVYSSLGMVYEDMLNETRKRCKNHTEFSLDQQPIFTEQQLLESEEASKNVNAEGLKESAIPHRALADQRVLAKKAYGSYHVAAILCKKDFTLWVRAAESALDIAEVHHEVIRLPNLPKKLCEYHRTERRRWQDEALRDFTVADNLKPPGIDVPAKLAMMHMELGNLSEALTILTDLKNRAGYLFQSSYNAWMLYSDLMLRLGHECIQWNKGVQTNENYMFRRWLRKFSKIFDWQERRLQGLSLAFEAAAGTENMKNYLTWNRHRSIESKKCFTERYSNVENIAKSDLNCNTSDLDESKEKVERNTAVNETKDDEGINAKKSQLRTEETLMMLNQSRELEAFDKTTDEMDFIADSTAAKERKTARNLLLKSHNSATCKLKKEFDQIESDHSLHAKETKEKIIGVSALHLPLSGSIRQVCAIASELMKHLLGLELYEGAKLVGDAVSCYMKQRARRHYIRIEREKRAEEWHRKILDSPFFIDSYDDDCTSSNEADVSYLSDEEALLDDAEDSPLVKSLSKGALTPELRVLYGLALIGEGGRNFIAAKCLEAIEDLELDTKNWFVEGEDETKHAPDQFWLLFRRAMTEELDRTGAYAFTADILKKTKKEHEWAFHFSPLFHNHLETLKEEGLIDKLFDLRILAPNDNFRKNQILKVVLEACKFDVCTIDERKMIKYALNRIPRFDRDTQLGTVQKVLTSIVNFIPLVWSIEADGALPHICSEVSEDIIWISTQLLFQVFLPSFFRL